MFEIESQVRSYCRQYPETFDTAKGAFLYSTNAKEYLDFLSGCGSLNYGHNNPILKRALIDYIERDGIAMGLDLQLTAKAEFLRALNDIILSPRQLKYKVQFPGPTGTNAVEAAIKLARKVTGRTNIVAFTNAFHGCSLGALALTGSSHHRSASMPLLTNVTRWPYDRYFDNSVDTADMLEQLLSDPSSGFDAPAAIIVELIQGEGGLRAASPKWLKRIAHVAGVHGALLIVDDIQAGCGRSGNFFSFEGFDVVPDMVVLAKAISGFGLPMSLLLLKPDLDVWKAGEHNGTFRGNGHAFVTATAALKTYWADDKFAKILDRKVGLLDEIIRLICIKHSLLPRGRGLFRGVNLVTQKFAESTRNECFKRGLIVETCGPNDEILKLLPPLTVEESELERASVIINAAISEARAFEPALEIA
jgi:diaminobutyrate-2-oxoglutarate transaminase